MTDVVTSILVDDEGKILILKRSDKVRTYQGLWSGVSGYVEVGEIPFDTALKEVREETGFSKKDIIFVKQLEPFSFSDFYNGEKFDWKVFSFLFKLKKLEKKDKLKIDWEHSEYCWIAPLDIVKFDTVPRLKETVFKLFG